jgi:hypothetical protein
MTPTDLRSLEPPYFHLVVGSEDEFGKYTFGLNYQMSCEKPCQTAVKVLRGKKMRTRADLFNEFAAVLQFPDYFGENWAALEECLDDLEWVRAEGFVVLISNVTSVLSNEHPEERMILPRVLDRVCKDWATSHRVYPSKELKPAPFHVVFHAMQADLELARELLRPVSTDTSLFFLSGAQTDQSSVGHIS